MRRLLYVLPIALFLTLAGYFALSLNKDPSLLPSALIDKPAPAFDLAGLGKDGRLTLAEIKGHVALINFFASWCVPCRDEEPVLMSLVKNKNVLLYGIAYKDKPADAERYLKELGDPYRSVGLDENGRTGINFGVYGVPETYVIDKEGRIRLRYVGPLTEADVTRQLLPLLHKLELAPS